MVLYIIVKLHAIDFLLIAGDRLHADHHPALFTTPDDHHLNEGDHSRLTIGGGLLGARTSDVARRMSERISRIADAGSRGGNRNTSRLSTADMTNEDAATADNGQGRGQDNVGNNNGGSSPMGFLSQLVQQNPELSGVIKATEKYIPFLLIAAAKGFFDHATGEFRSTPHKIVLTSMELATFYLPHSLLIHFSQLQNRNLCLCCFDRHLLSCQFCDNARD